MCLTKPRETADSLRRIANLIERSVGEPEAAQLMRLTQTDIDQLLLDTVNSLLGVVHLRSETINGHELTRAWCVDWDALIHSTALYARED
jgi:hypothetical protein